MPPSEAPKNNQTGTGCAGVFCGLLLGGATGGVLGFVLPEPYYQITNPQILRDGQWGMIFLLSIPLGIVIGAFIGAAVGFFVSRKIS